MYNMHRPIQGCLNQSFAVYFKNIDFHLEEEEKDSIGG
jgi:hypothetical protein